MALVIRLKRLGANRKPRSRIVVCENSRPRDARVIANIGSYDPTKNPAVIKIDKPKAEIWLKKGACPSETVRSMLKKQGLI